MSFLYVHDFLGVNLLQWMEIINYKELLRVTKIYILTGWKQTNLRYIYKQHTKVKITIKSFHIEVWYNVIEYKS